MTEKKEIKLCWIHKIVLEEIKKDNTRLEHQNHKQKEYKCPMCDTLLSEE